MARKIATVHTGNVEREEWFERSRFIPIVEMAKMPVESLHGGEGALRALYKAAQGKIPKIAGRQIGEQRQTHVRRPVAAFTTWSMWT